MIRSHLLTTIAIVLPLVRVACGAPATADPEFAQVLKHAKEANKDMVVFCDGSNWCRSAAAAGAAVSTPAARALLGDAVLWARHDQPELTSAEVKAMPKDAGKKDAGAAPDFIVWNIPALLLVDPRGFTFAAIEGINGDNATAVLVKIKDQLAKRGQRDALWDQAGKTEGAAKAQLLGRGLDLMPENTAAQRKDIIDALKKADPEDVSGYVFKYTFSPSGFHEGTVMKMLGEKNPQGVIALVDKHLANPRLTPFQRQTLTAAKAQAYRSLDQIDKAVEEWKKIVALAPGSDMAIGAENYLRAHTVPVRLAGPKWNSWDNPPVWLPMVVDVTSLIPADGKYAIEFKHARGHTRFGEITLTQGDTVLARDDNPKESAKLVLAVAGLQASGKVELSVKARGTGWFDGCGEIIISPAK